MPMIASSNSHAPSPAEPGMAESHVSSIHAMPFGAELQTDGTVRFRLFAPSHRSILLDLDEGRSVLKMAPERGWHELVTADAGPATSYRFILPDGAKVPDPASRFQPRDVHGPSEVIDPRAFRWSDGAWSGRPWHETVIYEAHVGAATPEGCFRALAARLEDLADLGITALQLMPIGDFPGQRNWGYDGVLPFAPDSSYGRPEDLKALVDLAHGIGLMVFLDVVYNHFGPEGAYLHSISPEFFTSRHRTPWGAAINMDGEHSRTVRDFFIHNALYWLEEFHLDGLRLDAVHEIRDESRPDFLEELARRVRAYLPGRHIHLILENEENAARRLVRDAHREPCSYDAQWNDDVHHVLHVAGTGEAEAYYADYAGNTERLARALAEGFAFQGEVMPYRGSPRGEPSANLPPSAFVAFIQNHDQVGNRAFGERLGALVPLEAMRALAATYLLLPQIPMLFMGEEWLASQPFPFFCDFGPELAATVRAGRRAEFARFAQFRDEATRETIPDPTDEETFRSAKLDWGERYKEPHRSQLAWYRRILAVRHKEIEPIAESLTSGGRFSVVGENAVRITWAGPEGHPLLALSANLSSIPMTGPPSQDGGHLLWQEGVVDETGWFGPWSVRWTIGRPL
jgi:malto-oligosyltrehalose trehalohydrolase